MPDLSCNELPDRAGPDYCWCDRFDEAPPVIALLVLGLLGGPCGEPVLISLCDYPVDIAGAIQRTIRRHVPDGQVREIHGRSDLRRLARETRHCTLVIIDPVRSHYTTELAARWMLNRRRGERSPCALFCSDEGVEQAPGAMLILRAHPDENPRIRRWLVKNSKPDRRVYSFLDGLEDAPPEVDFAQLLPLIDPTEPPGLWQPRTLRPIDVVRGLLAGRALVRCFHHRIDRPRRVVPSIEDYASIYGLLQRSTSGLPEEYGNRLVWVMVKRANLYLKNRESNNVTSRPFSLGRSRWNSRATPPPDNHIDVQVPEITRREMADLGNRDSAIVRSLLESLISSNDRRAMTELGLSGRGLQEVDSTSVDCAWLRRWLIGWSEKQVITNFDRLRRQGLVDAERVPPGNGAWVYRLPEGFRPLPGEFKGLPTPEQVARSLPRRE